MSPVSHAARSFIRARNVTASNLAFVNDKCVRPVMTTELTERHVVRAKHAYGGKSRPWPRGFSA